MARNIKAMFCFWFCLTSPWNLMRWATDSTHEILWISIFLHFPAEQNAISSSPRWTLLQPTWPCEWPAQGSRRQHLRKLAKCYDATERNTIHANIIRQRPPTRFVLYPFSMQRILLSEYEYTVKLLILHACMNIHTYHTRTFWYRKPHWPRLSLCRGRLKRYDPCGWSPWSWRSPYAAWICLATANRGVHEVHCICLIGTNRYNINPYNPFGIYIYIYIYSKATTAHAYMIFMVLKSYLLDAARFGGESWNKRRDTVSGSDHPKEPPTMEPITVTLLDSQTILGVKILGATDGYLLRLAGQVFVIRLGLAEERQRHWQNSLYVWVHAAEGQHGQMGTIQAAWSNKCLKSWWGYLLGLTTMHAWLTLQNVKGCMCGEVGRKRHVTWSCLHITRWNSLK